MRLLLVNYEYPPLGGGGGIGMMEVAIEAARRHTVHVLTSGAKGLPEVESHPEVDLTVNGRVMMTSFLREICGLTGNYVMQDRIEASVEAIRQKVGSDKVVVLVSGGVDSAVTAALLLKALDPDQVYAAARGGLYVSKDGGRSWAPATMQRRPATMVHVADSGQVYAFIYGVGLLAGDEEGRNWELRFDRFADRYLTHMTSDPANPEVLHVVSDTGALVTSRDGGRSWVSYAGHDWESPERIAEAGQLYGRLCQSCHGDKGVGERPGDANARDEYGFVAPALDNSAHGWHHGDDNLVRTILNGSPRNPRMMPFRDLVSEDEARDLVAYIKSLWSFRSLACQGARHMRCMMH